MQRKGRHVGIRQECLGRQAHIGKPGTYRTEGTQKTERYKRNRQALIEGRQTLIEGQAGSHWGQAGPERPGL
jgi:hypothetical protein